MTAVSKSLISAGIVSGVAIPECLLPCRRRRRRRTRRSRLNKAYSTKVNGVLINVLYIVETVVKMNCNYAHKT
jgi:hypothetical protein